jgi:transposase-like protein
MLKMAAKPQKKTSPAGAADPPLWRCPDCRRQFTNRNQSHACGRYTLASHFAGKPRAIRAAYRVGEQRHLSSAD